MHDELVTALSTVAIAVLTAALVGTGLAQWRAMRASLADTRLAAEATKASAEATRDAVLLTHRPRL